MDDFANELSENLGGEIAEQTIDEVMERVTVNIIMSVVNDYVRLNAELRDKIGCETSITRETHGGACAWCNALAGTYNYGDEPQDVYRRHDNCRCKVTYHSAKKKVVQDVWPKAKQSASTKLYQEAYLGMLNKQRNSALSTYLKFAERLGT